VNDEITYEFVLELTYFPNSVDYLVSKISCEPVIFLNKSKYHFPPNFIKFQFQKTKNYDKSLIVVWRRLEVRFPDVPEHVDDADGLEAAV
jgi:hypothetical protein